MKRLTAMLLCAFALLPLLCGCAKDGDEAAENITFIAVIEAVNDNSLLVSTTDDVGFDKASVSFAEDMTLDPDFSFIAGQTVRITILPQVAESYPVQARAVAIELVTDAEAPETSAEPGASAGPEASRPAYEAAFFRADSTGNEGSEFLSGRILNQEKMAISSVRHIPVMTITSREDLAEFIDEGKEYYQFEQSYGENAAFAESAESYDDAYFETHALAVLFTTESSGSIRHEIADVRVEDGALSIVVTATSPEIGTDDMADWFIVISLEKGAVEGCSSFDAWYE